MPDLDLSAVDAAFTAFHDGGTTPGIAYGVVSEGELVHAVGLGRLDVARDVAPDHDSVFRIASMTKSFTAATVLALRDRAMVRLDDALVEHLPELAEGLAGPTADSAPVTVRDLLTMGAGFATDDPWGDRQQDLSLESFDDLLRQGPARIGASDGRFEYSNLGYAVLGRLITRLTGRPYDETVAELVLRPLGMTATGFHDDLVPAPCRAVGYGYHGAQLVAQPLTGCGAFAPMGGLLSSVRDLAGWVATLAAGEPARDDPDEAVVLRRSSVREMQQPRRLVEATATAAQLGGPVRLMVASYGYGLVVEDDAALGRCVSHSGGYPGFGSHMRWHPGSGLGLVALANRTYAPMRQISAQALAALVRTRPRSPAAAPWARTTDAEAVVEQLFDAWDESLADRWFAMNMDLDVPRELRRQEFESLTTVLGRLRRDPRVLASHSTAAHSRWWLAGQRGRVRIDLSLSPQPVPLIQSITLMSVPQPSEALSAGARSASAAAALASVPESWGSGLVLGDVGPPIAGDGSTRAVYALRDERLSLEVSLAADTLDVRVVPMPQRADGAFL